MRRHTLALLGALALITALTTAATASRAQTPDWQLKVDRTLVDGRANGESEFLVRLADEVDLSAAAELSSKAAKGRYVYDTLRHSALASQAGIRQLLVQRGIEHRPYWITNMIWVRGDWSLIQELAQRPEVAALHANPTVQLSLPGSLVSTGDAKLKDEVQWNLAMVGAPEVWALGFEGQGIVVGGQDTGYDWTHPALKPQYRGWDGQTADHNYNWHDAIHANDPNTNPGNACGYDSVVPCDDGYHGTHTMGTMVGDDGSGTRTGMAPRATWIGCRNMEDGWGTPATYAECFEWFIAPYPLGGDSFTDGDPTRAPHVINNSWSCPAAEGCTAEILEPVVNAVRAAGIVTVQSAGNSGPFCETVNTPAAIYEATFTVGAVSASGTIAGFSSRGPAPDGHMKPEVVAPGVSVASSVPGGYGELSGTSMASPHVAGLVALVLSANPSLTGNVDQIEAAMTGTAIGRAASQGCGGDALDAVPNNVYGWGLIDAAAAVAAPQPFDYHVYAPFGAVHSAP